MGKKRIYELARELGVEPKEVLEKAKELDFTVRGVSSSLNDDECEAVTRALKKGAADVVEKRVTGPRVIIRRRAETPPAAEEVETPAEAPADEAALSDEAFAAAPETAATETAPAETAAVEAAAPETPATAPEQPDTPAAEAAAPAAPPEEQAPSAAAPPAPATPAAAPAPGARPLRRRPFQAEILSRPETPQERRQAEILYRPTADERARPATGDAAARKTRRTGRDGAVVEEGGEAETPATRARKRTVQRAELYDVVDPLGYGAPIRARKRRTSTKKTGRKTEITTPSAHKRVIKIEGAMSAGELAKQMGVKATELIKKLMSMGQMAALNQPVDYATAEILASEFGFEVTNVEVAETDLLPEVTDQPEDLVTRPPVVTIMGHVDHGKTTLLDAIRKTEVAKGEAGGITQHIGAYQVHTKRGTITFLDTPGHAAFTAMRARGAQVTDLVVLVVAADDGIMPQTVEAINHAKAAEVPIVIAVNKIDKPDANPQRVKQELMNHGLVVEEYGGEVVHAEVSAKTGKGVDELLELLVLQAELLDLKANPAKPAKGAIVEAKLDKGRGPVATVLIEEGTLRVGDNIITGLYSGRVRALTDDFGRKLEAAGPAMPVEVIGLDGVPDAGESLNAVADLDKVKEIIAHRRGQTQKVEPTVRPALSLEDVFNKMQQGELKELPLVIKADVQGSLEALKDSVSRLGNEQVKVKLVHGGVGGITESDVLLAQASAAIVIGFHVRPDAAARAAAERHGVDVRLYNIIYELIDEVNKSLAGLLAPITREKALGRAEVREVFRIAKVGPIAGAAVIDGLIKRSAKVRLIRDNVQIFEGGISSLKRFKDDVREVKQGYECGIGLANCNDLEPGDVIEAYESESIEAQL